MPLRQEALSLAAPTSGEAIQEQNLKAALDTPNIYVETTDNDGNPSVVEIEREVSLSLLLSVRPAGLEHWPSTPMKQYPASTAPFADTARVYFCCVQRPCLFMNARDIPRAWSQVALLSPYVQREVLQQGNGVSQDKPIILPNKVRCCCLSLHHAALHDPEVCRSHKFSSLAYHTITAQYLFLNKPKSSTKPCSPVPGNTDLCPWTRYL